MATKAKEASAEPRPRHARAPSGQGAAHRRQDRLGAADRPRHRHAQSRLAGLAARRRRRACGAGKQVMLVSSGAIALGRHALEAAEGRAGAGAEPGSGRRRTDQPGARLPGHVRARAASSPRRSCSRSAIPRSAARYLNARHTIETLLELKAVPVVNENDTVATTEIRYGDNDRLSARVASMVSRRLPRAAVRHRRPLYGAARANAAARRASTSSPRSRRRSRPWRATPAPSCRRAA